MIMDPNLTYIVIYQMLLVLQLELLHSSLRMGTITSGDSSVTQKSSRGSHMSWTVITPAPEIRLLQSDFLFFYYYYIPPSVAFPSFLAFSPIVQVRHDLSICSGDKNQSNPYFFHGLRKQIVATFQFIVQLSRLSLSPNDCHLTVSFPIFRTYFPFLKPFKDLFILLPGERWILLQFGVNVALRASAS